MEKASLANSSKLPLIRLSLCVPFLVELEKRHIDSNAVLSRNGLSKEAMYDNEIFVPAIVVHRFLESAAEAAQDTYLGVFIGENLEYSEWAPFRDAVMNSTLLLDFLTRFIHIASHETSSVKHSLDINNDYSVFKETRYREPEIEPSQNDAFTLAYVLNIIRLGSGEVWSPGHVLATVCSPEVIPDRYLGVTITGGDRTGMSVRFPSAWLHHAIDISQFGVSNKSSTVRTELPVDFIGALRSTIALHLDKENLDVEYIAGLVGYSKQMLQRKLKSQGTTLSKEIATLKKERAIDMLVNTTVYISAIAEALGFSNQASFTRAFKSWTNQTPREYRKKY